MADVKEEEIELRCLWQRTDYGHISLIAAARGYGGRKLGSYQDEITDEKFERVRRAQAAVNPDWPIIECVIKVKSEFIESLFTDGTVFEAES